MGIISFQSKSKPVFKMTFFMTKIFVVKNVILKTGLWSPKKSQLFVCRLFLFRCDGKKTPIIVHRTVNFYIFMTTESWNRPKCFDVQLEGLPKRSINIMTESLSTQCLIFLLKRSGPLRVLFCDKFNFSQFETVID